MLSFKNESVVAEKPMQGSESANNTCNALGFCLAVLLCFNVVCLLWGRLFARQRRWPPLKTASINSGKSAMMDGHGVTHLAVIMDGNRRYGRKHASHAVAPQSSETNEQIHQFCSTVCNDEAPLPVTQREGWVSEQYATFLRMTQFTALDGHRRGGEKLLDFISYCIDARIDMVTVYAFSTDNWNRPAHEVDFLMALFFFFFERIRQTSREKGMFIRFISTDPERLPKRVRQLMELVETESRTYRPRRIVVNVCVSYSGQSEIASACTRILQRRQAPGAAAAAAHSGAAVTTADIEGEMLRSVTQAAYEAEDEDVFSLRVPRSPQLLLRTSGEQRISNFLLYENAYTEFAFISKTWPEVTKADLFTALADYASREKRLGR